MFIGTGPAAQNSFPRLAFYLICMSAGACQKGHVTEQMVKEAARLAGASSAHLRGMRYFAIDSCWFEQQQRFAGEMGVHSEVKVDQAIFPRGVASLAQAIKDEGLIFGLGVSVSSQKCTEMEPSPME